MKTISGKSLQTLIEDFPQKAGVKGRVKKGEGKNLIVTKSRGKPIFCGSDRKWKVELEQRLENFIFASVG